MTRRNKFRFDNLAEATIQADAWSWFAAGTRYCVYHSGNDFIVRARRALHIVDGCVYQTTIKERLQGVRDSDIAMWKAARIKAESYNKELSHEQF